ncbi:MAG: hypothetical protein HYY24_23665 [Verrucomicrobia bacterium]|nr:hypothetical protein [Verrucomicrobiota bacterium]
MSRSLRRYSSCAGLFTVVAGSVALAGWVLAIPTLRSLLPGQAVLPPQTALAFVLAGLALWLLRDAAPRTAPTTVPPKTFRRRLGELCAGLVGLIGILTLAGLLLGKSPRIESWLGPTGIGFNEPMPSSRVAVATALSFCLAGCGLLLLDVETRRGHRPAQFLLLAAGLGSLLALIAYAYGVRLLALMPPNAPPTLPMVVLFLTLVSGALCARPAHGLMAPITSDNLGGKLARRLLPAALAVPFLVGLLIEAGEHTGWLGVADDTALFAGLTILVFVVLNWSHARELNRIEEERRQASEERERLIEQLQEALANVKTLRGLLPICAQCKKIRDDNGYWNQVEVYLRNHSEATFTHGLCPECVHQFMRELEHLSPTTTPD